MYKRKIEIIVGLLILIAASLAFLFTENVTTVKLSEEGLYNFYGFEMEVSEGLKLTINDNGVLCSGEGDNLTIYGTLPIYLNDENKIMLTSKLAYYKPDFETMYKKSSLSPMVTLSYDEESKEVTFASDTDSKKDNYGFLFDGHNTYILLEEMILTYDDKSVNLPVFSYIAAEKNNWVGYFNSETQEYEYIETFDDVYMKDIKESYRVNLSGDVLLFQSKQHLMPSNLEILKDYFTGK